MNLRTYRGREVATAEDLQAAAPGQLRSVYGRFFSAMSLANSAVYALISASRDLGDQQLFDELEAIGRQFDALDGRVKPTLLIEHE